MAFNGGCVRRSKRRAAFSYGPIPDQRMSQDARPLRSILIAAVMGVVTSVPAAHFLTTSSRHNQVAAARGDSARSDAVIPVDGWPICLIPAMNMMI